MTDMGLEDGTDAFDLHQDILKTNVVFSLDVHYIFLRRCLINFD